MGAFDGRELGSHCTRHLPRILWEEDEASAQDVAHALQDLIEENGDKLRQIIKDLGSSSQQSGSGIMFLRSEELSVKVEVHRRPQTHQTVEHTLHPTCDGSTNIAAAHRVHKGAGGGKRSAKS